MLSTNSSRALAPWNSMVYTLKYFCIMQKNLNSLITVLLNRKMWKECYNDWDLHYKYKCQFSLLPCHQVFVTEFLFHAPSGGRTVDWQLIVLVLSLQIYHSTSIYIFHCLNCYNLLWKYCFEIVLTVLSRVVMRDGSLFLLGCWHPWKYIWRMTLCIDRGVGALPIYCSIHMLGPQGYDFLDVLSILRVWFS